MNQDILNSLLDTSISDLKDLPEFKVFPEGAHKCTFNLEVKMIGTSPAVVFKFKAIETLELADAVNDKPLLPGDECDIANQMDNEFGQGLVKAVAAMACEASGADPETASLRDSFAPYIGGEIILFSGRRPDKKDKTKFYTVIKQVVFDIDAFMASLEGGEGLLQEEVKQPAPVAPAASLPFAGKGLNLGLKLKP